MQIAYFFLLKGKVFLHAGDIIDKFVDQDQKFRFCFIAHLARHVARVDSRDA
jgi:hypothetical protein